MERAAGKIGPSRFAIEGHSSISELTRIDRVCDWISIHSRWAYLVPFAKYLAISIETPTFPTFCVFKTR